MQEPLRHSSQPQKLLRPSSPVVNRTRPQPTRAKSPQPASEESKQVAKAPLIVTGLTLGSTSSSGAFAVGVGNTLSGAPPPIAVAPARLPDSLSVLGARLDGATLHCPMPAAGLAELLGSLGTLGAVTDIRTEQPSLEQVFLEITGK